MPVLLSTGFLIGGPWPQWFSGLLFLSATVSVGSAVLLGSAESLFLSSLAHACSLDIVRQQPHLEPVPKQLPSDLLSEHPCAADEDRFYACSGFLGLVEEPTGVSPSGVPE